MQVHNCVQRSVATKQPANAIMRMITMPINNEDYVK